MSINNKHYLDCEILAPAGSYQCMTAAFNAGADAVYVGGTMFGARAYAGNFDKEELIRAIDYAHLRGKKLYLTVNTLLKSDELDNELIPYLKPFYYEGLDAVIVQDMGVLKALRENFPDLPVHASTQMTVTGIHFAKELKELGVTRIVTARELSLSETRDIYEATGLEIESFVHGALCYSYSGQCLLSSLIGGRSGNRGRCAQPCRLAYGLYDENKRIETGDDRYLLSPKDMCTLNILPEILKAGVYSLKIEGRMKKPEYVAGTVRAYRSCIDILKAGNTYKEDGRTIEELKDIYNRGGFTDGYYLRQNGREMMSLYKPNHYGLKVGKILSVTPKTITFKALKDIDKTDVLEINLKNADNAAEIPHGAVSSGATATVKNTAGIKNINSLHEDGVFRTRNNRLIDSIEKKIIQKDERIGIFGICIIKKGEPIKLICRMDLSTDISVDDNEFIDVCVYGCIPDKAENKQAELKDIESRLKKTGATDFYFEELDIELDRGLFIPVSELNELRRNALDKLREAVLSLFKREKNEEAFREEPKAEIQGQSKENLKETPREIEEEIVDCIVSDKAQLLLTLDREYIGAVGLELSRFSYSEMKENIQLIKEKNKQTYIALPYVCRKKAIDEFNENIDFFVDTINEIDGFIARNYEEYIFFSQILKEKGIKKHFIFDAGIYMFNCKSLEYAEEMAKKYNNFITPTLPYELNKKELRLICSGSSEQAAKQVRMEIYGYIPVMTTAGCVKKTMNMCDKKTEFKYRLRDRKNNYMWTATNCRYCYNTIYNSVPLYLGNDLKELRELNIKHFSIRLTMENETEAKHALDIIGEALCNGGSIGITDFTRGHFRRGVM